MRCVGSAWGAWWCRCLRDYKRRCNSLPREGLQLCVAPYFATLGRGDMRGGLTQIAPRRWCGAVASAMVCIVLCVNVVWCDDGLPPPPGWHHGVPICGPRMSPRPRVAKYGATHGFNPCRGWGNVRLWSSASRGARCAMLCIAGGRCAAPDWRRCDGGDRANGANRANGWRC